MTVPPKPQRYRQRYEKDCGVVVFAALTGIAYENILRDLPYAHEGLSIIAWHGWLDKKGFRVNRREGYHTDVLPCAHMVSPVHHFHGYHWVYRDEEGDVHDPSPANQAMPANGQGMKALQMYPYKLETISISR